MTLKIPRRHSHMVQSDVDTHSTHTDTPDTPRKTTDRKASASRRADSLERAREREDREEKEQAVCRVGGQPGCHKGSMEKEIGSWAGKLRERDGDRKSVV